MSTITDLHLAGLPGPSLFYGGLSPGNLASTVNAGSDANPRAAARQCVMAMRTVLDLGMPVAFLPPLVRPDLEFLHGVGFRGSDAQMFEHAARSDERLLRLAYSNAFMWTANAATVIASADSDDGRVHLIPANLLAMPHRALEAAPRARQLAHLFAKSIGFTVHSPLPAVSDLSDEGAANHHRCQVGDAPAVQVFVHGRDSERDAPERDGPRVHPARQTRATGAAVARLAGSARTLHIRQHPTAIDAGAFHNDVVMIGTHEKILLHEQAWAEQPAALAQLSALAGPLHVATVSASDLPLPEAVRSYLFNSLLLRTPDHGDVLVAPSDCAEGPARSQIERLIASGFIARAQFVELRGSMRGGGGPACLRLRLPLTSSELAAVPANIRVDHARLTALEAWVDAHYRDRLTLNDLRDPRLLDECRAAEQALDALLARFS